MGASSPRSALGRSRQQLPRFDRSAVLANTSARTELPANLMKPKTSTSRRGEEPGGRRKPSKRRQVLILHDGGLSPAEIARWLGCPVHSVEETLRHLRGRVARCAQCEGTIPVPPGALPKPGIFCRACLPRTLTAPFGVLLR